MTDGITRGARLVLGVLGALAAFMAAVLAYGGMTTAVDAEPPFILEVQTGETFAQVVRRIGQEGRLRHPSLFQALAVLRGDTGRIKAGDYPLTGRISPNDLLENLVSGRGTFAALTVPEGFSLKDIAQRVEEQSLGRAADFIRLSRDPDFIAAQTLPFGVKPPSLEGFIFPETYYVHRSAGEAVLLSLMVREFKKRAAGLLAEKAAGVRLSPYEALILASIVEKETGIEKERPLVSAVFHNRLRTRIRLGSDPTVIYGIENFSGNLTRAHLRTPGPFNTYVNFGLPPTPIASPGLASLKAAVAPARADYLYFVSRGDGTHFFSGDYATHEKAVYRYQRRGGRRGS